MTMGALHEGHATLIRTARRLAGADGQVVVTVFVNPLQFGAGEDLDRYPRTLDADRAIAEREGADAVFAPSVEEVYPGGEPQVRVTAGPMGERLEGACRPGHFDGMLTVVAKLLHLTAPDIALYGQKDAQQLALIRRMVRDLNFPVEIVGVPTVREDDGLALSSRNRYLAPAERTAALALSRALFAASDRLAAEHALHARAAAARRGHGPGRRAHRDRRGQGRRRRVRGRRGGAVPGGHQGRGSRCARRGGQGRTPGRGRLLGAGRPGDVHARPTTGSAVRRSSRSPPVSAPRASSTTSRSRSEHRNDKHRHTACTPPHPAGPSTRTSWSSAPESRA